MRLWRPLGLAALLLRLARPRLGAFALLFVFVAGAALAGGYSALADDVTVDGGALAVASDSTSTGDDSTSSGSTADSTTVETATEPASEPPPTTTEDAISTEDSGSGGAPTPPPTTTSGGSDSVTPPIGPGSGSEPGFGPGPARKHHRIHRAAEVNEGGSALVWLHRTLP